MSWPSAGARRAQPSQQHSQGRVLVRRAVASGWMLPGGWPVDGTRSPLTESRPQSAGLRPRPAARLLPARSATADATLSRCRGAVLLPGRCLRLLVPFAEWRAAELPDAQVLIACLVARLMPVAPCVRFAALLQEPEVLLACIAARLMPVLPCVCALRRCCSN